MNLQQIDDYTYKRYLNMSHGLELTPDINLGYRGNENGIVYLASYLMMLDIVKASKLSYKSTFDILGRIPPQVIISEDCDLKLIIITFGLFFSHFFME